MTDSEKSGVLEGKRPEAWIGRQVMLETTEALSSDLRAAAPVYLEDVDERGVVMPVTRYFYPWSVAGWVRLADDDELAGPRPPGSQDVEGEASPLLETLPTVRSCLE